ncbi:hypothetical protein WKI68_22230 [Streptomyces sp. MS1.HAVA.3]|uniref:Uncharacterized protein n=1 Tax=Streptomyces caledonius TaxID=3134107 RepID=A0ABU8U668_9ACTN
MSPQEQQHSRGYSVPTGRPYALKELQATLGSLGDHLRELYDGAHPAEYDGVADALYIAFQTAAGLAPAKSYTGCAEHPNGALDPEAPEGWGRCLICNDRRRLGLRSQGARAAAAAPSAGEQRRLGYPVPEPRTPSRPCATACARSRTAASTSPCPHPRPLRADGRRPAPRLHRRPRAVPAAERLGLLRAPRRSHRPRRAPGEACIFCAGRKRRAQRSPQTPEMLPRIRRGERRQLQRRFERPPG